MRVKILGYENNTNSRTFMATKTKLYKMICGRQDRLRGNLSFRHAVRLLLERMTNRTSPQNALICLNTPGSFTLDHHLLDPL